MTSREQAREIAKEWTAASKCQKWGDYPPGDLHNMLENMIDGFESAEAQLREAEAALEDAADDLSCAAEALENCIDDEHLPSTREHERALQGVRDARQALEKLRGGS